ncbi:hypothetical protein RB595_003639 [Gaeumannomyces hyphopodioides]
MMVIGRGIAGIGAGAGVRRRGMLVAVSTNAAIISGFAGSSAVSTAVVAAYGDYAKHAIQKDVPYWLAVKHYWKPLTGCCLAWFLYDAVVHPLNLLAPTLVSGFISSRDGGGSTVQPVGWSALINAFALPGAFIGALIIDGWAAVCVFGFVIGGAMVQLRSIFPLFVTLYGLFQTLLSVGPRDCNFLGSNESFPTPLRSYFLKFAAAIGKINAAVGTATLNEAFTSFKDPVRSQKAVFLTGSSIPIVGTLVVWFIIPNVSSCFLNTFAYRFTCCSRH